MVISWNRHESLKEKRLEKEYVVVLSVGEQESGLCPVGDSQLSFC